MGGILLSQKSTAEQTGKALKNPRSRCTSARRVEVNTDEPTRRKLHNVYASNIRWIRESPDLHEAQSR